MAKFNIIGNTNIGVIGDNGTNIVYNSKGSECDIDLNLLNKEISQIIHILDKKENKTIDDRKILLSLSEIEELITKKEKNRIIEKIKECSSKVLYDLSTGIGSGILANIISGMLNIN